MKKTTLLFLALAASFCFGFIGNTIFNTNEKDMKVGAFSVSLSVKDIEVSKKFYETLGFKVFGGDVKKRYVIMKNENTLIGLFQGMFEGNMLTFNPGWDENAKAIETFNDVREIQAHLKANGIKLTTEVDEKTKGPGSMILTDPDGNTILFDQHR
jgi:catechol 2,3-dioxygenase-like lactoylglutathione lyase family enzyme